MASRLIDKDKGFNKFIERLFALNELRAVVGIRGAEARSRHEAKGAGKGIQMSELGIVHEFGSRKNGIPQRSFLRGTFDKKSRAYERQLRQGIKDVVRGANPKSILFQVGESVRKDIFDRIEQKDFAPNKPKTKKRKGSDTPLVDTGILRASIKATIRKKGSKE